MSTVDRTSPLLNFIENIINSKSNLEIKEIESLETEVVSKKIKVKKPKNIPDNILFIPIHSPQRGLQGYLLLTGNEKFLQNDMLFVVSYYLRFYC